MKLTTRLQLSLMMFLEFFIWGAWFVTLGTFLFAKLNVTGTEVASAYLSQSIGAILAPFVIGVIADRFFSAQKILGFLHLAGGALLWYCAHIEDFALFYPAIIVYMVLFMPTLALVNTVSFRQMSDPGKEFPLIRTLGTLGWIVAGFLISYLSWDQKGNEALLDNTFKMAAGASIALGLLSFSLPNTPPMKKGQKVSVQEMLGFDALGLLKDRSYRIFFISAIAICIPLAFYYNFTNAFLTEVGVDKPTAKQALGQGSELLFMLLMPVLFARFGVKRMLAFGMLAWVLRYIFFAFGDAGAGFWMLLTGIILHGICYDFFFVTGQIYTDRLAGERYKNAAQGLITLATYGVGMLIGSLISGPIVDHYLLETGNGHDWKQIWLIPAAIAAFVLLLFLLFFKEKSKTSIDSV
jgi:nucleoside transporter